MKKLTLSVAALSLAISGFCKQPNYVLVETEQIKKITINLEDLIEWVKEDEWHGRMMTPELSKLYTTNILSILSELEDMVHPSKQLVESCENCDEID